MDAYGRGSHLWTAGPQTAGSTALIRVTSNNGTLPQDVSDASFSIANSGQHYYVNDASTVGDFFTTAVGNNANSGKSPTAPMASLAALLAAYDLDPGDVIHVDTGNYTLLSNIQLTAQDMGVRIEGPSTGTALLNRNNFSAGSYAFEFQSGAKDVVLDHLSITGAYYGVYAGSTADSDGRPSLEQHDLRHFRQGFIRRQAATTGHCSTTHCTEFWAVSEPAIRPTAST